MASQQPALLLASLLAFASPLLPQGDLSPTTKVVAFDMGDMWPIFLSLRDDGSAMLHGNPWLGGITTVLSAGGVADIARLSGMRAGEAERVAMVGADGLSLLECSQMTGAVQITAVPDPELLGATGVRAVRSGVHHLLSVRGADGRTMRSYRSTGPLLGAYTETQAVTDYLPFLHDNGSGRLLVVTAAGLTCRLLGGAFKWSLPGVHGGLAAWPGPGPIKAAWVFKDPSAATWHMATLGDIGPIAVDDVSECFGLGEQFLAGFAVDADDDGDNDWLMKTSAGVSILWNNGTDRFVAAGEQVAEGHFSSNCVPDVVRTHGGNTLRLVDEQASSVVTWSTLSFSSELQSIPGILLNGGGVLATPPPSPNTVVDFEVAIAPQWLQAFSRPNATTNLQVIAWRQSRTDEARLDVAESNVLFELIAPPSTQATTFWPLSVDLAPSVVNVATGGGWQHPDDHDTHYWLTIRLVTTDSNSNLLLAVSEPVTIGLTCAPDPQNRQYDVLRAAAGLNQLESISTPFDPGTSNGGGVVGVIVHINIPPPPPSAMPAPRAADQLKQSNGHLGSGAGGQGEQEEEN